MYVSTQLRTRANKLTFRVRNQKCDPESANAIFSNTQLSNRITLIALDLSHQVLATPAILEMLLHPLNLQVPPGSPENTTPLRKMLHDLLTFFASTYAAVFNITEGPPLHDPLAVAAVLPCPILATLHQKSSSAGGIQFEWEYVKVVVDIHGVEIGRTQKHAPKEGETVVRVAKAVDVQKFWEVLMDAVGKADARGKVKWV